MGNVIRHKSGAKLFYEAAVREYFIESCRHNAIYTIEYCPWCGSKLPSYLGSEHIDAIEEAGYTGFDDPNLPEEFKTDEWWKKRGL